MPPPQNEGPTRVRAPRVVVRYSKVRVEVTRGPDRGTGLDVAGQTLRIGTADDNDLVLADDTVSRHHCELEPVADGIRVRDTGSTNGVFAGDARVFDALLPFEARVRVGDTELAVAPSGETIEREQTTTDRFGDLLGCSPRMRELFADLERLAATDMTLLVEGETGTGKDLIAESVHRASVRSGGPFVVFDCGAVSPALAESELFGHERGAFTGAIHTHPGVFEQADGGTLLLDEIGELPRELQPKLLRALENRQVRRVGGTKVIAFDARLVAATNRNLRAEVARGSFREDLYFRLAAAHVVAPALRDRMEDLPLLVEHFLALERPPRSVADVPEPVWDLFRSHRWPGNVRELRNAVQRLQVTPDRPLREWSGTEGAAPPASAAASIAAPDELLPLRIARREANDAFERAYLAAALARSGGSVTRAAALAEVSRQMMQKLLRKHGRGT
ncbi:MAG TPA: sigma 54-dependent Fis family transcriptional regulator [Polyangiaceae bacterium]